MSPEELAASAKKRNAEALGPTNAPGTISNTGVVPGAPIDVPVNVVDVPQEVEIKYDPQILSVTIGATLNLGNYSNVKLEVVATDGVAARECFKNEVAETVLLVQSTLKRMTK